MVGGVVRGRLVLPEFLPVLAQLLERSGLGLDSLAPSVDEEQRRRRDLALKEAAEGSDDELERYAARAALRGEEGAADPALPVIVDLAELDGRALRRLLVPGALLLGVPTERLRPGPRGREVLDFSGAESESEVEVAAEEAGAGGLLVVCEVAYDSQDPASGPRAALVERLDPPVCSGAEAERGEAYAWAEALCRLHAGAVFVAPEHQEPLAELLAGLGSPLAALSARSGAARARFGLALLRAARAEEAAAGGGAESPSAGASAAVGRAALGLGASSPCADASAVVLLLEGRDALPLGALACGVLVEERAQAHAVACSVGGGRRQAALQLTRRGLPRGRIAPDLPPEGALLAGSLFRRSELGEPGPPEEPVLSLVPPQGRVLADLLAQQVGLRVLQAAVAGGRPERVQSCRRLLEARCPSVRAEISADGREAALTGERGEAEAGAALLASLREERREVPKALGSRIVGRGGAEVRKLQEESGVLSLWVQKSDGGPFSSLEAFGEVAALERLDELLRQRHAHRSVAVSEQLAWRIVGKGGVGIRQLEEASGASLQVNSRPAGPGAGGGGQEASRSVDAMGEAEAVEKAVALVQQRVVPSARVEIPRRVVSLFIGKGGAGVKELEAASGAWLSVLAESDPCIAEICGDDAAVARAQERIGRFLEQNAFGSLEVSAEDLPMVVGRSWTAWREIQASTGASVTVDQSREPATVGVAGARGAVDAALARLRERAAWERRRLELPWRTAAHMVGRGGGGLRELERLSGAALWAEQGRGETCAVEITGDVSSVASAADLIAERTATVSIRVPEAAVAHVIGKCGATIKSIECNSGALVQIVDTTVQLSGLPEARAKAVAKVKAILASGNFLPATAEAEGSDAAGVAEMPGVAAVQGLAEPASLHEAPAAIEADEEKNEVAEEEAPAVDVSERAEGPAEGGDASAEHLPQAGDEGHDCRAETGSAEALSGEEGEAAEAVPASAPAAGGEPAAREQREEASGGASSPPRALMQKVIVEEPPVVAPSVLQSPTPARSCRGRSRSRRRRSASSSVEPQAEKDSLPPEPSAPSPLDDGDAPRGAHDGHAPEDAPSAAASCVAAASGCSLGGLPAPSQHWAQRPPSGHPPTGPPAQRRRASAVGSRRRAALGLPQASSGGFLGRVSVGRKRRLSTGSQPPRSVRAAGAAAAGVDGAPTWTRPRSRSPAKGRARGPSAGAELRPKLVLLDGMNVLRSSNAETSGSVGGVALSWGQLEQACRFYGRRRCRVSVFLPPVRAEHEPEFQRLRQLFGDVFVICQGGGSADDLNMINTVKVMEDQLAHEELRDGQVPDCRIVTNDGFRDWQRSGHVDAAWVERYCIRYAFGPLGFMPTCSSEWFGMQA